MLVKGRLEEGQDARNRKSPGVEVPALAPAKVGPAGETIDLIFNILFLTYFLALSEVRMCQSFMTWVSIAMPLKQLRALSHECVFAAFSR